MQTWSFELREWLVHRLQWNDSHELCAPQYLARSEDPIVNQVCTQILPFTYATSHSTSPSNDKAKVYTNLTTLIYAISQRSSVYPFRWLHRPINVCSCNVANCATGTALKAEECLSNIKQREKDPIKVIIKWEAVLVKDESFLLVSKKCYGRPNQQHWRPIATLFATALEPTAYTSPPVVTSICWLPQHTYKQLDSKWS